MRGAILYKQDSEKLAYEVHDFLVSNNYSARIIKNFDNLESYDFIVIVGGDGTILKALQNIKSCPPIFAINTGRVGLLTHCEPHEYKSLLIESLENFEVEEFMRLKCIVNDEELLALNEFAVLCSIPAKLLEMKIYIDDVMIESLRCDGVLVSTPLGSTAYALSTGGPIIDPYLNSILIVPVAPFKLGWKPWVVRDERKIKLEFDKSVFIIPDGQRRIEFRNSVTISKSEYPVRFFKVQNRLERLIGKLRNI